MKYLLILLFSFQFVLAAELGFDGSEGSSTPRRSLPFPEASEVLSCPDFSDSAIHVCFNDQSVSPITEGEFSDFSSITKVGTEPLARNLQNSLVRRTLNQIKDTENILRSVYPEFASFDSASDFNCREQTQDNQASILPDPIKDLRKAQLLRNQINGALIAEVVFSHKQRVEDQIRSTIGPTASAAYDACREEGLGYAICNDRLARATIPIDEELEAKMEKFSQIEAQLFQRYPMLFNTTNEESGIILPGLELGKSSYQRQIIERLPSVDVSGIQFNEDNGITEIDSLLENIDSNENFRNLLNRSLVDSESGEPNENYNFLLNEATPSAVQNHLSSLASAADNICDHPERLHHSDALVQLEIQALQNEVTNEVDFRERLYNLQLGYCELLDGNPKEPGFFNGATIAGGALIAGGVLAQVIPIAGTGAGAAAIFAGSAILFADGVNNVLNSYEDVNIYFGLNAIGAEDYSTLRDALLARRVDSALLGAEVVLGGAASITRVVRALRATDGTLDLAGGLGRIVSGQRARSLGSRIFDDSPLTRLTSVVENPRRPIGFGRETREAIVARLDDFDPDVQEGVQRLLASVEDRSTQTRYLSMLLNSSNPRNTLQRLTQLNSGGTSKEFVLDQIDTEIGVLSQRIATAERRRLSVQEIQALTRERSQLLQERFFIDAGDDIEITRVFSTDAYNARTVADDPTRVGHSLSDSFNLDIRVREGRNLQLCRGSYGTRGGLSAVTGGFMTLCRDQDYANRDSLTEFLAAPTDEADAFPGYQRFNRFELREGQELSFGLNGPVRYENGGGGGNGGGIEFFTSRFGGGASVDDLRASVRVPNCPRSSQNCSRVFNTQTEIRASLLERVTPSEVRSNLDRAGRVADNIVEQSFEPAQVSRALAGEADPSRALDQILNSNPDLTSAFNLRREIELKGAIDFSNPSPAARIDADTNELNRLVAQAKRARGQANGDTTADQLRSGFQEFLTETQPEIVQQYNQRQARIVELVGELRQASGREDQIRILQEASDLRAQQSDIMIAIKGAEDAFLRPTGHLGSDRSQITRAVIDQVLAD